MLDDIPRRGLMFVLSSPSGAGKTTLTRLLLDHEQDVMLSVSSTTRLPRPLEEEGKDYFFISEDTFHHQADGGHFLEYAKVFNHWYGTPQVPVEQALVKGLDVIFDVDWQGAQALTHSARGDVVKVFILPPSYQALEERLLARNQDSDQVIDLRMAKACDEISHWAEYDYVVVNHTLDATLNQIRGILTAERLKRHRRIGMVNFVRTLIPQQNFA